MRNKAIAVWIVVLVALLALGSAETDDFEEEIFGNTCKNKNGNECKLSPSRFHKGNKDYEKKLEKIYEKMEKKNTIEEAEERLLEKTERRLEEIDLPPEVKEQILSQAKSRKESHPGKRNSKRPKNIRNLLYSGPFHPFLEESHLIDKEGDYIY